MDIAFFPELDAAILQAVITLLVMVLCTGLWLRTRIPYFGWWAVAWGFYLARLMAIGAFLATEAPAWLYWHQVITGWTALALLWTSFVFARATPWRRWYLLLVLFPPFWSWIAIYRLQNPAPYMMMALSGYESPMVPKHLFEGTDVKASKHANAPVGTGPFRLVTARPGLVELAANPADPDEIYGAIEVGGVIRSRDGGEHWDNLSHGQYVNDDTVDMHGVLAPRWRPGTVLAIGRAGCSAARITARTGRPRGSRR